MSRIEKAYDLMKDIYLIGLKNGLDKHQIAREIDRSYPWGERSRYAYRAWLKARRHFFTLHGLPGLRDQKTWRRVDASPYTPATPHL